MWLCFSKFVFGQRVDKVVVSDAIGKSGIDAIHAVSWEYFSYVLQHPGIYETIQWATWHGNEKTSQIWTQYISLLKTLILSCGFNEPNVKEITDLLTGILHGYTSLQLRNALENPKAAKDNLRVIMETVLTGIQGRY